MVLTYQQHTVAEIHPDATVTIAGWILDLPDEDQVRRFVLRMIEYAVEITRSEHRDATQAECETYARASLIPGQLFGLPRHVGDQAAADQLGIPVDQLIAHRADYGYAPNWQPLPMAVRACQRHWRRRPFA